MYCLSYPSVCATSFLAYSVIRHYGIYWERMIRHYMSYTRRITTKLSIVLSKTLSKSLEWSLGNLSFQMMSRHVQVLLAGRH